jgi:hypothetical protein
MKPMIYKYDDSFERPVITIALLKKGKQFARGIALCSKMDHTAAEKGEVKAVGRATKAVVRKESCLPIRRNEAIRILFEAGAPPFKYKAEFPAKLTSYEKQLVGVV